MGTSINIVQRMMKRKLNGCGDDKLIKQVVLKQTRKTKKKMDE